MTSEGLLPPDQIKNLSRTVRRRRRNVGLGTVAWLLIGVSVLSYRGADLMSPIGGNPAQSILFSKQKGAY